MMDAALDLDRLMQPMSGPAFDAWALEQEGRWELHAGLPVRMMASGHRHSRVSVRLLGALDRALPGGSNCAPVGDGRLVAIGGANAPERRAPDAAIDCAGDEAYKNPRDPLLRKPVVIFEIGDATAQHDATTKRIEYFRNSHVQIYVLLLPEHEKTLVWTRQTAQQAPRIAGETLALDPPGVTLDLSGLWR